MKLPFDLGARFILRLAAPGIILSGVALPILRRISQIIYPGLDDWILYVGFAFAFGFALLLLDMPIYMLLEGRRYWPSWLRDWGTSRQQSALSMLEYASQQSQANSLEIDLKIMSYPIDRSTGKPVANYPTRLGNLLASFETYPTVKYGLDGVFFWPRLWVSIDKDLREELDSAQAVVDGAIYCCFVFSVSTLLCLGYAFTLPAPHWWSWPLGAAACAVLARLTYELALPRYAQYGDLFAATFDQYRDKLQIGTLLTDLDAHMNVVAPQRTEREQNRGKWRFLRWHRYRRPGQAKNETVKDW